MGFLDSLGMKDITKGAKELSKLHGELVKIRRLLALSYDLGYKHTAEDCAFIDECRKGGTSADQQAGSTGDSKGRARRSKRRRGKAKASEHPSRTI